MKYCSWRRETPIYSSSSQPEGELQTDSIFASSSSLKALRGDDAQEQKQQQRREPVGPTPKLQLSPTLSCQSSLQCSYPPVKKDVLQQAGGRHLPHTAHSKAWSCWNKHLALPVPSPTAKHCTVLACLPDPPSPLGEMKQEGAASPSKPPEATTHFTNLNRYISCRLGLIPPKQTGHHSTQNYIVYLITQLSQVSPPIPLIYFPDDRSWREGIKAQECGEAFLTTLTHMTPEVLMDSQGLYQVLFFFYSFQANRYDVCRERESYIFIALLFPGKHRFISPQAPTAGWRGPENQTNCACVLPEWQKHWPEQAPASLMASPYHALCQGVLPGSHRGFQGAWDWSYSWW